MSARLQHRHGRRLVAALFASLASGLFPLSPMVDRAGAERPTKDTPLSLGSPSKGKAHLVWGCVTSGGEAFQIVQGDTHGVWLSHQDGAGREKFEALLTRLGVGKSALFRVVSVQYMPAGTEQAQDQEVAEIE